LLIIAGITTGVRADWAEAKNDRFDIAGSLIYVLAMSSLMYGFSQLPGKLAIMLTLAGSIGLVYFVILELRIKTPVLNIDLCKTDLAFSNLAALDQLCRYLRHSRSSSPLPSECQRAEPMDAGLTDNPACYDGLVAPVSGRMSDRILQIPSRNMAIIVQDLFF
jgi:hypothetical protein